MASLLGHRRRFRARHDTTRTTREPINGHRCRGAAHYPHRCFREIGGSADFPALLDTLTASPPPSAPLRFPLELLGRMKATAASSPLSVPPFCNRPAKPSSATVRRSHNTAPRRRLVPGQRSRESLKPLSVLPDGIILQGKQEPPNVLEGTPALLGFSPMSTLQPTHGDESPRRSSNRRDGAVAEASGAPRDWRSELTGFCWSPPPLLDNSSRDPTKASTGNLPPQISATPGSGPTRRSARAGTPPSSPRLRTCERQASRISGSPLPLPAWQGRDTFPPASTTWTRHTAATRT